MPTAQEIIASDLPITLVLDVRTNNTETIQQSYSDWVGGKSSLAYPLDVEVKDNSQLYLSTGQVPGLASNVVVFGEFFIERSLQAPFEGGFNLDFAKLDIHVSGDDLQLYLRDWESKPFTIKVGYEGDSWSSFQTLCTGKTLGHSLINEGIQLDLSLNPTGTDKKFPVNRFDDGRVKPYIFGSVNRIRPVKVSTGLYQFHDGTSATAYPELDAAPYVEVNFDDTRYYGDFTSTVVDGGVTYTSTATDSMPSNLTQGDGSVLIGTSIKMTLPDNTTSGDLCKFAGVIECDAAQSVLMPFVLEVDMLLNEDSTVDNFTVSVNGNGKTSSVTPPKAYLSKAIQTFRFRFGKIASETNLNFTITGEKGTSLSSDDVIIEIVGIRLRPFRSTDGSSTPRDVKAWSVQGQDLQWLRTFRVPDATAAPSLPDFIAVYDDNGYIKVADDLTEFVIDAIGDATNDDLISALQYISTQANGSDSPIASSITSPDVGIYCNEAKSIINWWRELCDPLDLYLEPSLTTSTITVKRRYNSQVLDADGNVNDTDVFSFIENDMDKDSFIQQPNEPSVSRYEVAYDLNHEQPLDSPTETFTNPFARLNEVKRIETNLSNSADAQVIAQLNRRDGNRRSFYEFTINGAGHGLKPNDTGRIAHSKIKAGIFTLRFVREYVLSKKTILRGVKNG